MPWARGARQQFASKRRFLAWIALLLLSSQYQWGKTVKTVNNPLGYSRFTVNNNKYFEKQRSECRTMFKSRRALADREIDSAPNFLPLDLNPSLLRSLP